MKFAFLCDTFFQRRLSFFQKKAGDSNGSLTLIDTPNHEITVFSANDFLENPDMLDNYSCVIIERGTWQKNFSIFRYYRLLPMLEGKKLIFVLGSPDIELKGRLGIRRKEFVIANDTDPEEIKILLDKFADAQPFNYTHPKSGAVA